MASTVEPAGVDTIETLLRAAAVAHSEYEAAELGGVYDTDWPRWYATHIAQSLHAQGLVVTKEGPDHGTA